MLLVNHFPLEGSGSGVYTLNVAKILESKGHDVHIIVPENTIHFHNLEGVKIHPVYFKKEEVIEGQLPFNFPCFTTHPLSHETFFHLNDEQIQMYENAFMKTMDEVVGSFCPDIIHCGHIWILSSLATKYNIPLVITTHGTDILGYQQNNRFHSYANKAVDSCQKIITISKDNNNLVLKEFDQAAGKTCLIENGYDPQMFYPYNYNKKEVLRSLGIQEEYDKVVCFAGKLTRIKGVDLLIKAAASYGNENTLTLIAGNGELFDELNHWVQSRKIENIKFIGNVTQSILRQIYNISDVSIVPSRREAFGLVAIEALACGTPVVATNQGGIPDFLKEDVGILIDVDDVGMLAQAIVNILEHKIIFDKSYIAQYIREEYSQDKLTEKLIKIYQLLKKD